MKKLISLILVMMIIVSGLFMFSGCGNDKKQGDDSTNGKNENVETYELESSSGGKLTFDMPKDTGYEFSTSTNKATLKHKENASTIELYLLDTSKTSIIMKEKDFSASAYTDYKETEINGHEAYSIKKSNNFSIQYGILLDEYNKDNGKYHGLKIVVSKNSLKTEEFDPSDFVETDTFKTLLNSLKFEYDENSSTENDEKDEMKNYGEFESRTDGISDKKGLIFIKKYESPDAKVYRAEQKNDNVGIDNWLWYLGESSYNSTCIQVRVFPQEGTYENIDAYKAKKGDQYTWSKTNIAGKEYDTFVFGNGTPIEKYSKYYQGAFMVGNRVVEFSYTMYKDIEDQSAGDTFFNQIMNSIEYSKDFK
ncbi:MAG: hypothetical protein IJH12_00015 [Clostridia bacterium]|nr:hypothetical protein [Clostridia bacterium]